MDADRSSQGHGAEWEFILHIWVTWQEKGGGKGRHVMLPGTVLVGETAECQFSLRPFLKIANWKHSPGWKKKKNPAAFWEEKKF